MEVGNQDEGTNSKPSAPASKPGRQTFGTRRRVVVGLNVLIMMGIAILLSFAVVVLAFRPETRVRLDLTEDQVLALSEKSKDVLAAIETPVHVITLFHPTQMDQNVYVPGFKRVVEDIAYRTNDFLEEYRIQSGGKMTTEVLLRNSARDAERWKEIITQYQAQLNTVLVIAGDRRKALSLDDLAEIDRGNYNQQNPRPARMVRYRAEEALTSSILELTEEQAPVAYFLQGHGERSLQDQTNADTLALFAGSLVNDNYEVKTLTLEGAGTGVPDDADVLAIIAPEREIPESTVQAIAQYVERGGKLFVAIEPTSALANYHDQILLRYFGVFVRRHLVCYDATSAGFVNANPANLFLDIYGDAEPVSYHRDRKLQTIFSGAAALDTVKDAPPGSSIKHLVWTPREAWGDPIQSSSGIRQLDPGEVQGQQVIGLQAKGGRDAPGARLILFSDADFVNNATITQGPGNLDLGMNCFQWLAGREQLISITPKVFKDRLVDLTSEEFGSIFYYVVVWMPLGAVLLGLVVWWMRRR